MLSEEKLINGINNLQTKSILNGWPEPDILKKYKLEYPNISFQRKKYKCYTCYQENRLLGIRKDVPRCSSPKVSRFLVLKRKN